MTDPDPRIVAAWAAKFAEVRERLLNQPKRPVQLMLEFECWRCGNDSEVECESCHGDDDNCESCDGVGAVPCPECAT